MQITEKHSEKKSDKMQSETRAKQRETIENITRSRIQVKRSLSGFTVREFLRTPQNIKMLLKNESGQPASESRLTVN